MRTPLVRYGELLQTYLAPQRMRVGLLAVLLLGGVLVVLLWESDLVGVMLALEERRRRSVLPYLCRNQGAPIAA